MVRNFLPKWFRKILECGSYIVGGWLGWKVGLSENRSAFNSHWQAEHKWPLRNNFPLDSSSWLSESTGNKFQRDGIGWSLQWDSADMSIAVRWHWQIPESGAWMPRKMLAKVSPIRKFGRNVKWNGPKAFGIVLQAVTERGRNIEEHIYRSWIDLATL